MEMYSHLLNTVMHLGLMQSNARPLTIRNFLGFIHRVCGEELMSESPWTKEKLLHRYHHLKIQCQTLASSRAHAHWMNVLLQIPALGSPPLCLAQELKPTWLKAMPTAKITQRRAFAQVEDDGAFCLTIVHRR